MQRTSRYWPSVATYIARETKLLDLLVVILLFSPPVYCKDECTADSSAPSCVCAMPNGKKIDLRSLARQGGHAAFPNIKGKQPNTVYSYNPCYNFTDGGCEKVAGCQNAGGAKRSIGEQSKAKFRTDNNGVVSIAYSGGNGQRKMLVRLMCNESHKTPSITFLNEAGEQQYEFLLTTQCACPGACNGGHHSSSSGKISKIDVPGVIILSVLVILIVVYFVAGMIILRVKYNRTGSDIIPNKGFWMAIPFLVKDGCVFTFTPCKRCYQTRSQGYSKF